MSQENVAHLTAALEAWNAGDMDALREIHDPDAVLRMPDGWPEPGPFVGREAIMRQFELLDIAFSPFASLLQQFNTRMARYGSSCGCCAIAG